MARDYQSVSEFERYLNDNGIVKVVKGEKKDWKNVKKLLQNQNYIGIKEHTLDEEIILIEHANIRIISDKKWKKVQEKLKLHERKKYGKRQVITNYKNRAFCKHCHENLEIAVKQSKGVKYHVYRCSKHKDNLIGVEQLHKKIWSEVLARIKQWHEETFYDVIKRQVEESVKNFNNKIQKLKVDI
ncbi:recombinase family protein, partial [Virgibacillus sp. DJP39]|uniref:recombinase family protein n=1 Tax=Virgibacillus sp. DJP39 TaxID=3409790 RepID=UPI003BB76CAE